ncbi:MAG: DUF4153 domain-containing protein [Bacteroidales bacterium]
MKTTGNQKIFKSLAAILILNPVEVIVTIALFLLSVLTYHKILQPSLLGDNLMAAPIAFAIPYILNRLFRKNNLARIIYYLSALVLIPIFLVNLKEWIFSPAYGATIVITLLAIAAFPKGDNSLDDNKFLTDSFVNVAARIAASFAISVLTFLIAMAILFSTSELFEFSHEMVNNCAYWTMSTFIILFTPMLFLYASHECEDNQLSTQITKIRNIICTPVVNYILTPALIIFTAIIYLYILKIAVTFTLPNGTLSIIVTAYIIAGILIKALTGITEKEKFSTFYKYLYPLFIIPLILFWVGAFQRVSEYGFTDARVYLFVSGAILTISTLMLMFHKTNKYLYICYIAITLLSIFTFIPPISAKSIGEKSQRKELQMLEQKLNITPETILPKEGDENYDPALKDDYERVQNIRGYLRVKTPATALQTL